MTGFRHLGDEVMVDRPFLQVVTARFEAPDGTTFERDVVRNKGAVAMVPVLDDGRTVLLVRQYRGPIDRELLEIPAGLQDVEGEAPEVTAQRELAEEVGRHAGTLQLLCEYDPVAGFSDHVVRVYLATDLTEVPENRQGPEEDHMTIETFDLLGLDAAIADGTLRDAKTLIGLLLARDGLRIT
jgi:8-oxo-dGTP pyrophosphatase MutT (NUDIX family)